jgi:uncharacterized protein YjbI with pentapeptide repeats
MATFTMSDEPAGSGVRRGGLRGARFIGPDLSGVVLRGVDVSGADIDAPCSLTARA